MKEYEIEKIKEESRSLEARLEKIKLSNEEISDITKDKSMRTLRNEGLNLMGPIGKLTIKIMEWHEEKDEEIRRVKEQRLLEEYFNKTDDQLNVINKLKNFVTDPYGFAIFSKIRAILDNTPPDSELIRHLSTVLKNIVDAEYYELLFDKTKFVLGQIEKLTAQSLTIIVDEKSWPIFDMNASTYAGGKISSEFHTEFGKAYAAKKGITDEYKIERIIHSVRELQNANLLEGYKIGDDINSRSNECKLTEVGNEVAVFLK